ncbi:MAG: bifunctional molybdenum cofactor biosynthesis protein MoaC/MoaB [Alphaproteobacteria bacterium]
MFQMTDIGGKVHSYRLAVAQGFLYVGSHAFDKILNKEIAKGDPITVAEIAGIQGAKKAYELLPLCHPMLLDQVEIFIEMDPLDHCLIVTCFASTIAKTGVEMEALCGVNAALLAAYDLIKSVEKCQTISNVSLLLKKGGKSGIWLSEKKIPEWILQKAQIQNNNTGMNQIKSVVLTLSDRASNGTYLDESGETLKKLLKKNQALVVDYRILPDEEAILRDAMIDVLKKHKPNLIITTGGTGPDKRDITSKVVSELADKILPGIGEMLRLKGSQNTPFSWLSCSLAVIIGETLVVCLPGSNKAVLESFYFLDPILSHLLKTIKGHAHDHL